VEVYFLIADCLIKQNQILESIEVYREILGIKPEYKNQIYLLISKKLLYDQNADPNILIDFINEHLNIRS